MIRASVVVPVYNAVHTLPALLNSLATQQDAPDFELVLVDDGSTDAIESVVNDFQAEFPVNFIRQGKNQGPGVARNTGIFNAVGEIVVFTDADCCPEKDWLKKMTDPFADPVVVGVKGVYKTFQTDLWARLAQVEFVERYELLESKPEIDFIDTYSGAYRKEALIRVGGFNTTYRHADNEDVDLAFRVKKSGGRFVFVKDAVVFHLHREGWWNYARLKYGRGFWRMKVYGEHLEKAGNDSYTPTSLKAQLLLCFLLPFFLFSSRRRFIWKTAWFFSCVPLLRIAFEKSADLTLMVPVFCLVRGISILFGMASGGMAERQKLWLQIKNRFFQRNNHP